MLKFMNTNFSGEFIKSVLFKYDISLDNIQILAEHEKIKLILECCKDNKYYIIRIYIGDKNNEIDTIAECEWILYLDSNGISVSKPVESKFGKIVENENFEDNTYIIAVFEKAQGRHINAQEYTIEHFSGLGKTLGKIHKLSKCYVPLSTQIVRHKWSDSRYINWLKDIPSEQKIIKQKANVLLKKISAFPKDKNSYGMTHCDFNSGNYFINNSEYTIFDFFDCEYGWYANDIAVAVFYSVPYDLRGNERIKRAEGFYKGFIYGYLSENNLSNFWLEKLPDFLKLREYIIYGLYTDLTANGFKMDFIISFMEGRKENLENEVPYFNMSFKV